MNFWFTMEAGCDLQVDVNGEQSFIVNKNVFECFSGRFRKLFSKMSSSERNLKVILQGFPGGAEGFELVSSFCCNNGEIEITPFNIVLLYCAAYFMEMNSNSSAKSNLIDRTEKFLQGIKNWNWSELLFALKQCQDLFPATNSSLLQKILDSVVEKFALLNVSSSYTSSSSENFSSDTSSSCSTRKFCWWFEDFVFLDVFLFDEVIRMMVFHKLDHSTIFKFLLFYSKSKFPSIASQAEKRKIMKVVINLLSLLDRDCLSCKGLFEILRIVSRLKGRSKCCKLKLERLIGSRLDQATLDQLIIRSPPEKHYVYDVNLVLRIAEAYLFECWMFFPNELKKVCSLMDSYLIEVAPDFHLKPSKFAALLMMLPESARESNDRLYQAIDLYLEVHTQLSEEEKVRLCSSLNEGKLSAEALEHLAQNSKFPSRKSVQDFVARQPNFSRRISDRLCSSNKKKHAHSTEIGDLEMHLQQMQWRVGELEKVCKTMRIQMPNVTEPRLCNSTKVRYLPKFCS